MVLRDKGKQNKGEIKMTTITKKMVLENLSEIALLQFNSYDDSFEIEGGDGWINLQNDIMKYMIAIIKRGEYDLRDLQEWSADQMYKVMHEGFNY